LKHLVQLIFRNMIQYPNDPITNSGQKEVSGSSNYIKASSKIYHSIFDQFTIDSGKLTPGLIETESYYVISAKSETHLISMDKRCGEIQRYQNIRSSDEVNMTNGYPDMVTVESNKNIGNLLLDLKSGTSVMA